MRSNLFSRVRRVAVLALLPVLLGSMRAQSKAKISGPADAIFINGNVYAGAKLVPAAEGVALVAQVLPRAQAVAVKDGLVLALGTNAQIRKLRGKHTQVIDLAGRFVMPGFNDAHLHVAAGGFKKLDVGLSSAASLGEMLQRIAARVRTAAPGEWLQGRGWDQTTWSGQRLPTRQEVDAVTGGHPAIFLRVDGHIAVANSAALQAAGIDGNTANPPGGEIDRDANGEPTGILRERAVELVTGKIPLPPPSVRRKAIELTLQDAAQYGVTSLQDSGVWEDFLIYEELEQNGKLTARIYAWQPFDTPLAVLQEHRARHSGTDSMLRMGMLKGFMDGSLGSRTAALLEPYADDPNSSGLLEYEPGQLYLMADERAAAGFQLGFHAIGDRGTQLALDAFEEAERYVREHNAVGAGKRDFRFRIEHDQVIAPRQFARFRQLGVIASVQPNHLLTDMNWAEARLGSKRARQSYPWRQFLDSGVPLAYGTDYPVEPITPFRGIYASITRKSEAGDKSYYPEQRLTLDETLAAYTWGAAFAEFAEREKGTLEPGMLADFVVLDRDLTKVAPSEILGTRVLRTVVGGKTVYEAK